MCLIDGNQLPKGMPCKTEKVIGGDALSLSIAAASIVAKVTRDRMCEIMHCEEPHYGFASHKGYSAVSHFAALDSHGPGRFPPHGFCALHRSGGAAAGPRPSVFGTDRSRRRGISCKHSKETIMTLEHIKPRQHAQEPGLFARNHRAGRRKDAGDRRPERGQREGRDRRQGRHGGAGPARRSTISSRCWEAAGGSLDSLIRVGIYSAPTPISMRGSAPG